MKKGTSRRTRDFYDKYIGKQLGFLTINYLEEINKRICFNTTCICGKTFHPRTESVLDGKSKSCGCKRGDLISNANKLDDNMGMINIIYHNYKGNAITRNLEFNLSLDKFKKFIFADCKYCGRPPKNSRIIKYDKKRRRREKYLKYNGIDRTDNNIGYIESNCVTCCIICNRAKSNLSTIEFDEWIEALIKFKQVSQ